MSASKQKGTAAETAVVRWLISMGFPFAERRAMQGAEDRGDISGLADTVLEVKNYKVPQLPKFVDELKVEVANDDALFGAVVMKRRGTTDVGKWYAVMEFEDWINMRERAMRCS